MANILKDETDAVKYYRDKYEHLNKDKEEIGRRLLMKESLLNSIHKEEEKKRQELEKDKA